jgi:hypothetical protein
MSVHQENLEADCGTAQPFNDILSPMVFRAPDRLSSPLSWQEHIPFAFWLVERAQPRLLVELGTMSGNSYLAFCQAVQTLGLTARCYAVDTWEGDAHTGSYGDDVYWTLFADHDCRYGSFSRLVRSTFDQALTHFEDASVDLLHIDGLHTYEAMRHDFETWRPKLSSRAVALLHDTNSRDGSKLWTELAGIYPNNFQFVHGLGLGVLGVGEELPVPLRGFFARARHPKGAQLIRDVYGRLGAHCSSTLVQHQLPQLLPRIIAAARVSDVARRIALLAPRPVVAEGRPGL